MGIGTIDHLRIASESTLNFAASRTSICINQITVVTFLVWAKSPVSTVIVACGIIIGTITTYACKTFTWIINYTGATVGYIARRCSIITLECCAIEFIICITSCADTRWTTCQTVRNNWAKLARAVTGVKIFSWRAHANVVLKDKRCWTWFAGCAVTGLAVLGNLST